MADYRRLDVWNAGRRIVVLAYGIAAKLSPDERFGLISQIQRAAVSIPANIAEGAGRGSDRDFARFVRIAIGSANELDTLLILLVDLSLVDEPALDDVFCELRDLTVRMRNLAKRLDCAFVHEEIADYDESFPLPLSAIASDRPQS